MDIDFWRSVEEHDFNVPHEHAITDLTTELLSYLDLPNSELREMAFLVLGKWIGNGLYAPQELRVMGKALLSNLSRNIGESETDSVFRRSFSSLVLGKIIDYDTQEPFLSESELGVYLAAALAFLANERDLRGYVPEKGWIHTPAHAADFLAALAKNPRLDAHSLEEVLAGIAVKITARIEHVFLRLEDERLAYAAMCCLQRNLVSESFLAGWVEGLSRPSAHQAWPDLIEGTEAEVTAWHNTRDFLRDLFFQLTFASNPPISTDAALQTIRKALRAMDLGFYQPR